MTSQRAPSQKATDAERGARRGVQAVGPGNRADTMEACTPPMLKPLMPVVSKKVTEPVFASALLLSLVCFTIKVLF